MTSLPCSTKLLFVCRNAATEFFGGSGEQLAGGDESQHAAMELPACAARVQAAFASGACAAVPLAGECAATCRRQLRGVELGPCDIWAAFSRLAADVAGAAWEDM